VFPSFDSDTVLLFSPLMLEPNVSQSGGPREGESDGELVGDRDSDGIVEGE
jgi:hypothetical protein